MQAGRPALLPESKTKTKEAWAPPRCHSDDDDVGATLSVVSIRNTNNNNNKNGWTTSRASSRVQNPHLNLPLNPFISLHFIKERKKTQWQWNISTIVFVPLRHHLPTNCSRKTCGLGPGWTLTCSACLTRNTVSHGGRSCGGGCAPSHCCWVVC